MLKGTLGRHSIPFGKHRSYLTIGLHRSNIHAVGDTDYFDVNFVNFFPPHMLERRCLTKAKASTQPNQIRSGNSRIFSRKNRSHSLYAQELFLLLISLYFPVFYGKKFLAPNTFLFFSFSGFCLIAFFVLSNCFNRIWLFDLFRPRIILFMIKIPTSNFRNKLFLSKLFALIYIEKSI